MKTTGMVRRVDSLGRIVIPKEIRKNLRIKVGESIEIYIEDENIVLMKFSMINKIQDLAQELTDAVYTFMKHSIFITDINNVIAASGPLKKDFKTLPLGRDVIDSIDRRENMIQNHIKELEFCLDKKIYCSYVNTTILSDGEVVGMIYIINKDEKLGDNEFQMAQILSSFITKYLEQ